MGAKFGVNHGKGLIAMGVGEGLAEGKCARQVVPGGSLKTAALLSTTGRGSLCALINSLLVTH